MNADLFKTDPRSYALELVADGLQTADHLLLCALKYLSHDDCREMLDMNELSPRFYEEEEEEDQEEAEDFELSDEEEVREAFWEEHPRLAKYRDDAKSQNDYNADIRTAFVDWVDVANRDGRMSGDLAREVTL
jgi:hypothetical protein